jgi:hypothetical protein
LKTTMTAATGRIASLVIATLVGLGAASVLAEDEPLPAVQRCQEFCGRVYGEGSDEHQECAAACTEADACHQRCKKKFGEDLAKVRTCLRTCMSRRDSPPPEPEEPAVPNNPPVQL